jgi:hypothetical protein
MDYYKTILSVCIIIQVVGIFAMIYQLRQARKHVENIIDISSAALKSIKRQPLSVDQISMIFNRVYPAQPLSQNVINLVQEVEKHHEIR